MNKQKLTNLQEDILRFFFIKCGMKYNQNQIAKQLNVSSPAIMKSLPKLVEENLITQKQETDSNRLVIELNRDNPKVIQLKQVDNLKQLYETEIIELLEHEFAGATIILFGSFSKGEDTITSDIDLAIIGRKEKDINLQKYEQLFERKISLNFYESFNNIHKNLKENILNGITLSGGIEL